LRNRGYFVQPTVLVNTKSGMKVMEEEIFGPVVCAVPFSDPDDVVNSARNNIYGLAAALRAGTVWINCFNIFDDALPFGGDKQSGWGREMGAEALDSRSRPMRSASGAEGFVHQNTKLSPGWALGWLPCDAP
jgi:phenylacetaldehyde dehydrogenase